MPSKAVYEKIARAYKRGTGTRLSWYDVQCLVQGDDAIEQVVLGIIAEWEEQSHPQEQDAVCREEE